MAKRPKVKLSKKFLKEKYPVKVGKDEEVAQFTGRLFLVLGFFIVIALSVDIFHFTH